MKLWGGGEVITSRAACISYKAPLEATRVRGDTNFVGGG